MKEKGGSSRVGPATVMENANVLEAGEKDKKREHESAPRTSLRANAGKGRSKNDKRPATKRNVAARQNAE